MASKKGTSNCSLLHDCKTNSQLLNFNSSPSVSSKISFGRIAYISLPSIPVKISTGRMVSTIRPGYRTAYALVRYVASRQFAKNVSSSIDTHSEKSIVKVILEKIKDFFYS